MGYRFRKSINLGGGFRVNISKSGIGYSWGVKGYRVTKTAKGTVRRTYSIPGTGFSYVEETSDNNGADSGIRQEAQYAPPIDDNHYDTRNIVNNVASDIVSPDLKAMLASARKAVKLRTTAIIWFLITLIAGIAVLLSDEIYNPYILALFFVLPTLFAIMFAYVNIKGVIILEYNIDSDRKGEIENNLAPIMRIMECSKVWRIMQTSKVIDRKYTSGAANTVQRTPCTVSKKPKFPFESNIEVASFKAGNETLLFLPDKLLIIQGNNFGALNYSDITTDYEITEFVESEVLPKDAEILYYTWRYVNKNGGPDRRFKNNRQIPVCKYGEITLRADKGLDTVIMYSNPNI